MAKRTLSTAVKKATILENQFDLLKSESKPEVEKPKIEANEFIVATEKLPTTTVRNAKVQEIEEDGLLSRIQKRKEKKKIEDTHSRQTFLIRNELADQLGKLYKKYGYGFKTEFINAAIEKGISSLKDEEKLAK